MSLAAVLFATFGADDTGYWPKPRVPVDAQDEAADVSRVSNADASYVARIRTGDREAFSIVYLEHYAPMWRLAHRITGSSDAANDVVQDVFLAVWRRKDTWEPRVALFEYFLRAARNRALRAIEHAAIDARATEDPEASAAQIHGAAASTPDDLASGDEVEAAVSRAVAELPERQRSAFLLKWDQGMSLAQIGRVLGISDVAAGKLVGKAQARLREVLDRFR